MSAVDGQRPASGLQLTGRMRSRCGYIVTGSLRVAYGCMKKSMQMLLSYHLHATLCSHHGYIIHESRGDICVPLTFHSIQWHTRTTTQNMRWAVTTICIVQYTRCKGYCNSVPWAVGASLAPHTEQQIYNRHVLPPSIKTVL